MLPACSAVLAMQTPCSMTHRSSSPGAIGQSWLLQPRHANPANLAFALLPGASRPCQPLELPVAGGSLVLQSMERVRGSRMPLGQCVSERPCLGLTVHWHPCPHLLCPYTGQHPKSCRPLHKFSPWSGTSHSCAGPTTRMGQGAMVEPRGCPSPHAAGRGWIWFLSPCANSPFCSVFVFCTNMFVALSSEAQESATGCSATASCARRWPPLAPRWAGCGRAVGWCWVGPCTVISSAATALPVVGATWAGWG